MLRTALVLACVIQASSPAFAGAAEPEIDCSNALSTLDMNACASKDFSKADAELNEAYQNALKSIPEMAGEDPNYNAKAWEDALRKSQRAWLVFRDAECLDHISMFWTGGSGGTVDAISCQTEKTEARTKELKDRYEAP